MRNLLKMGPITIYFHSFTNHHFVEATLPITSTLSFTIGCEMFGFHNQPLPIDRRDHYSKKFENLCFRLEWDKSRIDAIKISVISCLLSHFAHTTHTSTRVSLLGIFWSKRAKGKKKHRSCCTTSCHTRLRTLAETSCVSCVEPINHRSWGQYEPFGD